MKKYCGSCNALHEVSVKQEQREYEIKGIKVSADVTVLTCENCHEEIYDKDTEIKNDILLFDEFKAKNNLLTSKEVKQIRDKYGISQATFALILGFGEKNITRYENGANQDNSHDSLLRLVDEEDNFLKLYYKNKHCLSKTEASKIAKRLCFQEKVTTHYHVVPEENSEYKTKTDNGGLSYGRC